MKSNTVRHLFHLTTKFLLQTRAVRTAIRVFANDRNNKNITYEGTFENFSEVFSLYKENVGYVSEEYLISERNKVSEILANSADTYTGNNRDNYLLLLLSSIPKDKIRILDVGSGFGLTFLFLNNNLEKAIEYTGIDLKAISDIALQYFGHHRNFHLLNLSDIRNENFDVVYFGSSLQYFENYKKTLLQTLESSPQIVFIADTPVGDLATFVTCQVNMKNRKIPRWVFSFSEIIEIFKGEEYELIAIDSVDWHSNIHNFSNFPKAYHHISHKNLVFSRNKNCS